MILLSTRELMGHRPPVGSVPKTAGQTKWSVAPSNWKIPPRAAKEAVEHATKRETATEWAGSRSNRQCPMGVRGLRPQGRWLQRQAPRMVRRQGRQEVLPDASATGHG